MLTYHSLLYMKAKIMAAHHAKVKAIPRAIFQSKHGSKEQFSN